MDAILRLALEPKAYGEIFNVGSDIPVNFLELTKTIIKVAKRGSWSFAEFSLERKAQEPGDFYSDITKINRFIGWRPKTSLEEGLAKTIDYYTQYGDHYWPMKYPSGSNKSGQEIVAAANAQNKALSGQIN